MGAAKQATEEQVAAEAAKRDELAERQSAAPVVVEKAVVVVMRGNSRGHKDGDRQSLPESRARELVANKHARYEQ